MDLTSGGLTAKLKGAKGGGLLPPKVVGFSDFSDCEFVDSIGQAVIDLNGAGFCFKNRSLNGFWARFASKTIR